MPHYCYIIYSLELDKFYVGETSDFDKRLEMHNRGFSTFTAKANDWVLYFIIPCANKSIALKLEAQIKSMKSRRYIENLQRFPEMSERMVIRYFAIGNLKRKA